MNEYPQSLINFLTEQIQDGAEMITTHNMDSTLWIIKPSGLQNWYVLVEWMEGMDGFSLVNINGRALERFLGEVAFNQSKK